MKWVQQMLGLVYNGIIIIKILIMIGLKCRVGKQGMACLQVGQWKQLGGWIGCHPSEPNICNINIWICNINCWIGCLPSSENQLAKYKRGEPLVVDTNVKDITIEAKHFKCDGGSTWSNGNICRLDK